MVLSPEQMGDQGTKTFKKIQLVGGQQGGLVAGVPVLFLGGGPGVAPQAMPHCKAILIDLSFAPDAAPGDPGSCCLVNCQLTVDHPDGTQSIGLPWIGQITFGDRKVLYYEFKSPVWGCFFNINLTPGAANLATIQFNAMVEGIRWGENLNP